MVKWDDFSDKNIEQKTIATIQKLEQYFGVKLDIPKINYYICDNIAGIACYDEWEIIFNPAIYIENKHEFIKNTVPHEVAHLVDRKMNGIHRKGGVVIHHSPSWKQLMKYLGADPSRISNFKQPNITTNSRNMFLYRCDMCDEEMMVSKIRHNKSQNNNKHYYHKKCGENSTLLFTGKKIKTTSANQYKVNQLYSSVFDQLARGEITTEDVLNDIIDMLIVSKSTAQRYLYSARKSFNQNKINPT